MPLERDTPMDPLSDCFKPPAIPTLVHCLHCGEEYESYLMYWETGVDARGKPDGFWCCGTDGCDGRGFGFDVFPIDPDYVGEDGRRMSWSDDDEAEDDESATASWDDDDDTDPPSIETFGDEAATGEWTPDDIAGEDDIPW